MTELEKFADRKRLPIVFLTKNGVEETEAGIRFTNGDARTRIRARADSHKTLWAKGDNRPMRVYGYDRVEEMTQLTKTALIVEGESDSLTAWFHKRPALGIPGSSLCEKLALEDVSQFDRVVAIREPDEAGRKFAVNVPKRLRALGYSGKVVVVDLPVKDLSDLHVAYAADPAEFDRVLDEAITNAQHVEATVATHALDVEWGDAHPWPVLHDDALFGLPGIVVRCLAPLSEGDPANLLTTFLAAFGAAVGLGPHVVVGSLRHPARLFVAHVGESGRARKGQGFHDACYVVSETDPEWYAKSFTSGLSTGEGLINHLAHNDGSSFVYEPELARLFAVASREGSSLSAIVRDAYDRSRLQVLTRKDPLLAESAHVVIVAQIVPDELRAKLTTADMANGFGNRFLFVAVRRAHLLPFGGDLRNDENVRSMIGDVRNALVNARGVGEVTLDADARTEWQTIYAMYAETRHDGLLGAVTGRPEAHTLRIALIYALADGCKKIGLGHLRAARALWSYCEASAAHFLGNATGFSKADQLLAELREAYPKGLTASEQRRIFSGHVSEDEMQAMRATLVARGLAVEEQRTTGGRPARVLTACPRAKSAQSAQTIDKNDLSALIAQMAQGWEDTSTRNPEEAT